MIPQNEALAIAEDFLQTSSPYAQMNFQSVVELRLPSGWRVPFDFKLKEERLSEWHVILFVSDDGTIEVELDTIAGVVGNTDLYETAKNAPVPELPPLADVVQALADSHETYGIDECIIETTEPVWTQAKRESDRELTRYWRLVLLRPNGERAVAYAGYQRDTTDGVRSRAVVTPGQHEAAPIFVSEPQIRSRQSARQWDLGRAKLRRKSGYLTVNLNHLNGHGATPPHPLNLWTIWSCISSLTEHIGYLGYAGADLHQVIIQLEDLSQAPAKFNYPDKIPTITFPLRSGWAEELTIVLHELGHALWWLFYTRAPMTVRDSTHRHILEGIQEGFCDYLAATMVAGDRTRSYVRIGQHLDEEIRGLPRHIGGRQPGHLPAFADLNDNIKVHDIGLKWANFLWAIRTKLGPEDANRVILRAHLKPLLTNNAPAEPFAAYVQSLENTAGFFKIPFCQWHILARDHGLIH